MKFEKKILSIDFDDDDKNYQEFTKFIENNIKRRKNKTANDIELIGEDLLAEIDEKKRRKNLTQKLYIDYILNHSKNNYTAAQLMNYDFEEIRNIYYSIKNKPSLLQKIIRFIFNL